ncbi:2-methylisocitrate lyase-like PEP mutase family enzyme [Shimia isoporae]|uniref:2-methylisocitrate lyase-like PEP mutase family enzyme n=1 Tax=Shimia isoporae TaxID=647720 RepID=A0A4R1NTZ8_9RHOB|nr:isocitrate lyase/phosphoenolpyruvate mutase family protein [Shimia isoporae]TCL08748.1 2-methylisocitrate lyase-like PEP mutase family enzyme [Shimia isoporae]
MIDTPSSAQKAETLKALHLPGTPVVLYNIWDAGSAGAVAKAGAKALATGSWSVAEAQGFRDGESLPMEFLFSIVERIVATNDLPLTVDFEGGYAMAPEEVSLNVERLISAGAVGLNFEDRVVKGKGLHAIDEQTSRVKAVRAAGDQTGIPIVINARTDLFLQSKPEDHASHIPEALERAAAYAEAGGDSFFVPGLSDPDLIQKVCTESPLPVNVMLRDVTAQIAPLAALGVGRISFGPTPYAVAMKAITEQAKAFY